MQIFKELTGLDWHADARIMIDDETKITEFDFEKYLNADLLKNVNTNTPEFKEFIHQLNFISKTKYEAH